jgi:hypothetical protein
MLYEGKNNDSWQHKWVEVNAAFDQLKLDPFLALPSSGPKAPSTLNKKEVGAV